MVWSILQLIVGLGLLLISAVLLVDGASALARRLRMSELLIGLTVVAFGTSAPELAVSTMAAFRGQADLAAGNVIGSNTFNILVILGLSSTLRPLQVQVRTVWRELPMMLGALAALGLLVADAAWSDGVGLVGRLDGLILLVLMAGFVAWSVRSARRDRQASPPGATGAVKSSLAMALVLTVAGLAGLVLGSDQAVDGAISVARLLGVSDLLIAVTIVAGGTSLPELATSAVAAARRQADLAVGNVLGSNIFNVLCVLGLSAALRPVPLVGWAWVDLAVCGSVSLVLFGFMFMGRRPHFLDRWEGVLMLAAYVGYVAARIQLG